MSETIQFPSIEPNSPASIAGRAARGQVHWTGPLVLVCLRTTLLIAAQAFVAGILLRLGHQRPWREAGDWWAVYGTVADIGCLIALRFFVRREKMQLRDLLGPIRMRSGHDLWLGLGYYLLVFPVFFGSTWLARSLIFPHDPAVAIGFLSRVHPLPVWAVVYGVGFWWMLWSPTEEATYQAYALPRIEALTGHRSVAVLLVGFCWAAQHCALPLILDWRYLAFRFVSFFPGVLCLMAIYMRTRRLTPLIFAHWPMDIAAAIFHVIY
ncbi:MAG: CPBP family glutamic-type intramembrane protease [Terracidiphilus sp.]